MKPLLQMFGLILALAWVPITSHCSWESVIGGDFFKCAAAEKGDCSNDDDSCAAVESGSYKVPDAPPAISAPVFAIVFFQIPAPSVTLFRRIAPSTAAPLEIFVSWQFVSRTALPPRAPSFVS